MREIQYGINIRGMRLAGPGARAQPLDPDTIYRAFVTAGKISGQHDFRLAGPVPAATNAAAR